MVGSCLLLFDSALNPLHYTVYVFLLLISRLLFDSITMYGWESMIPLGFFAATGFYNFIDGSVQAAASLITNELGAGNATGAKFTTIVSLVTSLIVGLLFLTLIMSFPDTLAMIFTSSSSVITMVNELAVLLALTILVNCIQPILSGVAVGCGWQALVAYVNIGSYYLGIWAGIISGTVVQTLILSIFTIRCNWDKELWHIVGPSIFYRIASNTMNITTQVLAGHLGDLELASISIANNVIVGLNFVFLYFMIFGTPVLSNFLEQCTYDFFKATQFHMWQKVQIHHFVLCFDHEEAVAINEKDKIFTK
ncbi:hypothetical protein RJ639_044420 [Escallonia herrerae]|uniref:Uncharacterized protein n=1 Tax=Escallonia herrerae TaxID=1293975 RepID=A0AA88WC24_9ASTE|nr:hypothetical protein RJ639_044420 [Escallonia herrerae]